MRMSSLLTTAAFAVSLVASTAALAANFSGVPELRQQQTLLPVDRPVYQPQLQYQPTGPYDSPDFVIPPYNIFS